MIEDYKTLYSLLLDSLPTTVLVVNRGLTVVSANRNFLRKSKQSADEVIGKSISKLFSTELYEQLNCDYEIRQVFENKCPSNPKKISYRAPGVATSVFYFRLFPLMEADEVTHVILLMDDITQQVEIGLERERIEQHLTSIVDSASDIILTVDEVGAISSWNPAAEEISGRTLTEVTGEKVHSLFPDEIQPNVQTTLERVIRDRTPLHSDWPLISKSGEVREISWVCSPLVKPDKQTGNMGNPLGMVMVGRDLTIQKKLEQQLIKTQKLSSLGVMAGGIAHQVKNPLAICSSAAQFLKAGNLTEPETKKCVDKIHNSVTKASAIIENLLNFARPGSKGGREIIDLVEFLQTTVALVHNQAMVEQVDIRTSFPEGPVFIHLNSELFQQALINIFLNAIEAMKSMKGGVLSVKMERLVGEVSLEVADNGPGMEKAILEKIFDPFYTNSSGTGLGLSICHSIIDLLDGSIKVDSIKGKGSTFTLRLPLPH